MRWDLIELLVERMWFMIANAGIDIHVGECLRELTANPGQHITILFHGCCPNHMIDYIAGLIDICALFRFSGMLQTGLKGPPGQITVTVVSPETSSITSALNLVLLR